MVVDSPLGGDDMDTEATSTDLGDVSATDVPQDEKVEDGEITEVTNESSEKIADGDGLGIGEEELTLEAPKSIGETAGSAPAEIVASRRSVSPRPPSEAEESRRPSPVSSTSTTINLLERAKQRAAIRQAGAQPTHSVRGVGRIARGRGVRGRGGRVGRGQAPGDQGQPSSKG
ncbi:hypothetical protein MLD38_021914 [Melastoma candidum]|nr:hypothetical protein MLD38_021914 [Melastoma candidum]